MKRRAAPRHAPLALLAALALSGCATLDHGTLDDVPVVTQPPGATVSSTTGTLCTSPCAVWGPRNESFGITVAKPGYETQSVTAEAKPDAAATAASSTAELTSDALGRVVDLRDGALYRHEPKAFVLKLVPTP